MICRVLDYPAESVNNLLYAYMHISRLPAYGQVIEHRILNPSSDCSLLEQISRIQLTKKKQFSWFHDCSFAAVAEAETLPTPPTTSAGKILASCQQSNKNEDPHNWVRQTSSKVQKGKAQQNTSNITHPSKAVMQMLQSCWMYDSQFWLPAWFTAAGGFSTTGDKVGANIS